MPISVTFNLKDLIDTLSPEDQAALSGDQTATVGDVLNGEDVWYEYLTQDDDKVRPSHAALHGTRWRVDDPNAPTPPLDYGCRCFMRYIAAPDSNASELLPEAKGELSSQSEAFKSWLGENVSEWEKIAQEARKLAPADRLNEIIEMLKDDGQPANSARDVAYMILSVL